MSTAVYRQKQIAETIGRNTSVVSWELKRNREERNQQYKPELAQRKYESRLFGKAKQVRFTPAVQAQ